MYIRSVQIEHYIVGVWLVIVIVLIFLIVFMMKKEEEEKSIISVSSIKKIVKLERQ